MSNKKLTVNPQTGQPHTAKLPMFLSFLAGVIVLGVAYMSPEFTFGEALPISLSLWVIGGIGAGAMARRA